MENNKNTPKKNDYINAYIKRNIEDDRRQERVLIEQIKRSTKGSKIVIKDSTKQNLSSNYCQI